MEFDSNWCRHCGADKALTKEHIPPRATGNDGVGTLYREVQGVLKAFEQFSDGHAVPTLCGPCNNGASDRGLPQAYAKWQEDVIYQLRQVAAAYSAKTGKTPNDLWSHETAPGVPFILPLVHGQGTSITLQPGRVARQILGMILAIQMDKFLLTEYPQLKEAYEPKGPSDIGPMTLHVALANLGMNYLTSGGGKATVNLHTGSVSGLQGFWMLSCPPFLMALTEGDEAPISGTRIDHWFKYPAKGSPATEQFSKSERRVSYPIANRKKDLLVAKMYQDQALMPTSS